MEQRTPFASLLFSRRKACGLSQEQLAHKLGKKQSTVSAWENGTNGINLADFYSVARALDMTDSDIAEAVRLAGRDVDVDEGAPPDTAAAAS